MAASITSLSSLVFAALAGTAIQSSAGPLIECPKTHSDGFKTGVLYDADVFQGPPKNAASLIPDEETSEWELEVYQRNSEQRGESLQLVCSYSGIKSTVAIEIPRAATFCKVEDTKRGTVAFCGSRLPAPTNSNGKVPV